MNVVVETALSVGIVLGRTDRGVGLWPAPGAHPGPDTVAEIADLVREHKIEIARALAEADSLAGDPAEYVRRKTGAQTYFFALWQPYQVRVDAARNANDLLGMYAALDCWREAIECYCLPRHADTCSSGCLID